MANGGDFSQIMAEKSQKRPSKGILKTSSSFDKQDKNPKKASSSHKATKWDEMNIIATLHPPDKDYGHMKIEEPKTPYNWDIGEEDEVDHGHELDPSELADKLQSGVGSSPRRKSSSFGTDSDDSDTELTPEELARRKVFKSKRKMHYNEFKVVEFARKLIKADEEALANDDDDDDNSPSSSNRGKSEEDACADNEEESNPSDSVVDDVRLQDSEGSSSQPAPSDQSSTSHN